MTNSLDSKNILVTGATGFIGAHLCQALLLSGYQVFGLTHSGDTQRVSHLLQQKPFQLLQGDIRSTDSLYLMLKNNRISAIFHLAARLPHEQDLNDPFPSFDTNVRGTINLLHAANLSNISRFIYSSSIDVYTEPPDYLPVDEKHPTHPRTNYGVSKLAGEFYTHLYSQTIKTTILRYSIVYGKGAKTGGAVNRFIHQALSAKPLTIYGEGEQSNDFVYVADVVKANILAFEKDQPGIYNIGSGVEIKIKDLAQTVVKLAKSASEIISTDIKSDRPFSFALDISLAGKRLGYYPLALENGLSDYIKQCQME
jgi:UDP-glucose 4-epimerase